MGVVVGTLGKEAGKRGSQQMQLRSLIIIIRSILLLLILLPKQLPAGSRSSIFFELFPMDLSLNRAVTFPNYLLRS